MIVDWLSSPLVSPLLTVLALITGVAAAFWARRSAHIGARTLQQQVRATHGRTRHEIFNSLTMQFGLGGVPRTADAPGPSWDSGVFIQVNISLEKPLRGYLALRTQDGTLVSKDWRNFQMNSTDRGVGAAPSPEGFIDIGRKEHFAGNLLFVAGLDGGNFDQKKEFVDRLRLHVSIACTCDACLEAWAQGQSDDVQWFHFERDATSERPRIVPVGKAAKRELGKRR